MGRLFDRQLGWKEIGQIKLGDKPLISGFTIGQNILRMFTVRLVSLIGEIFNLNWIIDTQFIDHCDQERKLALAERNRIPVKSL